MIPCYIIHPEHGPFVHGYIVGNVPAPHYEESIAHSKSFAFSLGWTSKALVKLETFAKGSVVEIKWDDLKVTDTIEQAKDACNKE